jgi:non-specific serine/threonine protein kinase
MLYTLNRYGEAHARLDECVPMAGSVGELTVLAHALALKGWLLAQNGSSDGAISTLQQAIALSRRLGVGASLASALAARCLLPVRLGRHHEADRLLGDCVTAIRGLGIPWLLGIGLSIHGRVALELGSQERAEYILREAVTILARLGDTWSVMYTFTHLAAAATMRLDAERAALLFGAADALNERTGASVTGYEDLNTRCRLAAVDQLGSDRFEALRLEGWAMPLDELVRLATGSGARS